MSICLVFWWWTGWVDNMLHPSLSSKMQGTLFILSPMCFNKLWATLLSLVLEMRAWNYVHRLIIRSGIIIQLCLLPLKVLVLMRSSPLEMCCYLYMALGDAVKELLWLTQLLKHIGLKMNKIPCIFEDNGGCSMLSTWLTSVNKTIP